MNDEDIREMYGSKGGRKAEGIPEKNQGGSHARVCGFDGARTHAFTQADFIRCYCPFISPKHQWKIVSPERFEIECPRTNTEREINDYAKRQSLDRMSFLRRVKHVRGRAGK